MMEVKLKNILSSGASKALSALPSTAGASKTPLRKKFFEDFPAKLF